MCPDHQLSCVPVQALLQDTAAAPLPPPTSSNTGTQSNIEPRVAVVLQGVSTACSCCTTTYRLFSSFESHGFLTARVFTFEPALWFKNFFRYNYLNSVGAKLPLSTASCRTQTSTCAFCLLRTRRLNFSYMPCFFFPCTRKHSDVDVCFIAYYVPGITEYMRDSLFVHARSRSCFAFALYDHESLRRGRVFFCLLRATRYVMRALMISYIHSRA